MLNSFSNLLKKKSCTVLTFHGVIANENKRVRNYNNKHISKKKFIKIIKNLKKKGKSISINELYTKIKNKVQFDDYSFLVTFDDGFKNNFTNALPILIREKIFTCFFITTNFFRNSCHSFRI